MVARREVKRVLWVEDYPENKVSDLFDECETKIVSTMEQAIKEISGKHLYDYDTIVLDIDFENGLPNGSEKVIEELTKSIFLSNEQKNKNYIINNGGYLLFLYLLEKGYPSNQIAFLTGNAGIVEQLKLYSENNRSHKSKDEIIKDYIRIWKDSNDDIEQFISGIESLNIDKVYTDTDFIMDCAELIDTEDLEELQKKIYNTNPIVKTDFINNTGDMMIYRFHEANLESPVYFSKNSNDINGHNYDDAKQWLISHRTNNNVTRWLLLDAAEYIEKLFRDNTMNGQFVNLFVNVSGDPGIRSSFRQMFFVFDGLRAISRRGIYYQAITSMLIPFSENIRFCKDSVAFIGNDYLEIQRFFCSFAKQTRNYCAHNYFGSSLSNESVLFILMGVMLGILSRNQREGIDIWFINAYNEYVRGASLERESNNYDINQNLNTIDLICNNLLSSNRINEDRAHVFGLSYVSYTAKNILNALGYNNEMDVSAQPNTSIREQYYIFSLAAYIVKWFYGISEDDIEKKFGIGIRLMYQLANIIVAEYEYPTS